MSSTAPPRPVRPDARTFRRRRLVALLILLGLIGAVVAGVVAVKNRLFPADPPPVEPAAAPTGPTEEELANPTECAAKAVELEISLAADSLPAGQATSIPLTVRNAGEVPCLLEVGHAGVEVRVTSGNDPVWSSTHCGASLPEDRRILLDVGASDTTVVTWSGARSAEGCPGEQPATTPGTYRVHAAVAAAGGPVTHERVFGMH